MFESCLCRSHLEKNNKRKKESGINVISKQHKQKLLDKGIIKHKGSHYVDKNGDHIGVYRTKGAAKKTYIEDKYANMQF